MEIFYYRKELNEFIASFGSKAAIIGFVPTMGALHKGHLSLIHKALEQTDLVIANIFVNPKQFDNAEDLEKYPVQHDEDIAKLRDAGCHAVFIPSVDEVYPTDYEKIEVDLGLLKNVYEGEKRDGHFEGVIQVLYQLFSMVNPRQVFFGQKDYQQCMVVNSLLKAHFPEIEMVTCPTERDEEGLALSSRNQRLSPKGLKQAKHLNKGLSKAIEHFDPSSPGTSLKLAKNYLQEQGIEIEYLDFADADTLTPYASWSQTPDRIVALAAVYVERIRLIDNRVFVTDLH